MDADQTTGISSEAHPIGRNQHLKRVSLLIQSKKYPGQTFVGYALLHEFNPKRLSFFSAQKFPVDDELEVEVDYFGTRAQLKGLMASIHEQISSGRVMNAVPDAENPFPVRKFYRCYAVITALKGLLPGMAAPEGEAPGASASADPVADVAAIQPGAAVEAAPAAEGEPVVANAGDSLVSPSDKPADSDDIRAKLAAISGGGDVADEKQAA